MTEYYDSNGCLKDSSEYLDQINKWMNENYELIMHCTHLFTTVPEKSPVTVRQYQPRKYGVKATEYQRAASRAYYIANREAILEKRRIHNLKLKSKKNLNLSVRSKKS